MSGDELSDEFDRRYRSWKAYVASPSIAESSSDAVYVDNDHFREILALGADAIPLIIEKLETDPDAHFLVHALPQLSGKKFSEPELQSARSVHGSPLGNQGYARMWIEWWKAQGKK